MEKRKLSKKNYKKRKLSKKRLSGGSWLERCRLCAESRPAPPLVPEPEPEPEPEPSEEEKVAQFCDWCDTDEAQARHCLEAAGWDLHRAVDSPDARKLHREDRRAQEEGLRQAEAQAAAGRRGASRRCSRSPPPPRRSPPPTRRSLSQRERRARALAQAEADAASAAGLRGHEGGLDSLHLLWVPVSASGAPLVSGKQAARAVLKAEGLDMSEKDEWVKANPEKVAAMFKQLGLTE